jgi:hypothetical protein
MKKLILLTLLAFTTVSFGQKITGDANLGLYANNGVSPGITGNIGLAYNFTSFISARLDAGADYFGDNKMSRLSLHALIHLDEALKLTESNFGLTIHAGAGVTNRVNNNVFKDNYRMQGDGMVNTIFGLTPKFKLSEKMTLQLDASCIFLLQSDTEMTNYVNGTIGIAYTF